MGRGDGAFGAKKSGRGVIRTDCFYTNYIEHMGSVSGNISQ